MGTPILFGSGSGIQPVAKSLYRGSILMELRGRRLNISIISQYSLSQKLPWSIVLGVRVVKIIEDSFGTFNFRLGKRGQIISKKYCGNLVNRREGFSRVSV